MGGNPFGPAGTGKTESVKALGAQLGRFVLVFNCDESFDYSAMGRLFAGLCQVGGWAVCKPLTALVLLWESTAVVLVLGGDNCFHDATIFVFLDTTMAIPTVRASLLRVVPSLNGDHARSGSLAVIVASLVP